jgi:hypothetical protein
MRKAILSLMFILPSMAFSASQICSVLQKMGATSAEPTEYYAVCTNGKDSKLITSVPAAKSLQESLNQVADHQKASDQVAAYILDLGYQPLGCESGKFVKQ